MSKDTVKQYQQAVAALESERASLQKTLASAQATVSSAEKRLAEIDAALGVSAAKVAPPVKRRGRPAAKKKAAKPAPKKAVKKAAKKVVKKAAKKAPAKRAKNKTTLKDVVLQVTKGKALDAKQIFEAAQKAGHKFSGKNPMNSIRVLLYTNKKLFKNNKGKFTAA